MEKGDRDDRLFVFQIASALKECLSCHDAQDKKDHEDDDKDEEQNARNSARRRRDIREAQRTGDHRHNEKNQSPFQHDSLIP
jgi:hypothetical protein